MSLSVFLRAGCVNGTLMVFEKKGGSLLSARRRVLKFFSRLKETERHGAFGNSF